MIRCGRALSPRVCLRSFTNFQLPGAAISQSARPPIFDPASAHQRNGCLRSFIAASAALYPRGLLRSFPHDDKPRRSTQGDERHQSPEHTTDLRSSGPYHTPDNAALSNTEVEQAKRDGAIFELSTSSVDELATELQPSSLDETSGHQGISEVKPANRSTTTSSRSNRSKALPPRNSQIKQNIESPPLPKESWRVQRAVLKQKFPEGWKPRKRLSPDAIDGIRALHARFPEAYTTETLAAQFEVSPEAIRRILKSNWQPSAEEEEARRDRWFNRGKSVWSQWAELGKKPPKRWRSEGVVRDPRWNKKRGPRLEYPYVPRKHAQRQEDEESTQRKLGDHLL